MKAQAAEMDFREMQENLNKAGYKEKNYYNKQKSIS